MNPAQPISRTLAIALSVCTLQSIPAPGLPTAATAAPLPAQPATASKSVEFIYKILSTAPQTASAKTLTTIGQVLERRAQGLGWQATATVQAQTIKLRVTGAPDSIDLAQVLSRRGWLEFREQRPGTATQFQAEKARLETLQREVQQLQTGQNKTAIAQKQAALQRRQTALGQFFLPPVLTSKDVSNAWTEGTSAPWMISLEFTPDGGTKFVQLTQRLAGTGRAIGIFVDQVLISAPIVGPEYQATGIQGGKAVVSGNFDAPSARHLSVQLKAGPLPAPIELLDIKTVP